LTWLRARPLQENKIKKNYNKKNVVRLVLVEGTTTSIKIKKKKNYNNKNGGSA
jgi:hypothetical protein